ncbi:MAG TPA: serine/threonine-protein kinase [Gemmatimonadales bacterium]|nr:serine/threonine-protein kinase [Gemmatimonadales bacterium]
MSSAPYCTACGATIPAEASVCPICQTPVVPVAPAGPSTEMPGGTRPSSALPDRDDEAPMQAQLRAQLEEASLGEYDIIGELGRGGMATVYLAHEIALERKVAIKVMSPAVMLSSKMAERFKLEARTAAALSHPNIVPIYAVRETDHLVYFVMKCLMGRPLDNILKEVGQLHVGMVQTIFSQVASALSYAHKHGVIHRDVKPANIMIDEDGAVVVTDFGIAKAGESQGLTVTGSTIGTPAYMSPEQCGNKNVGPASDQYSLGTVVYEMLAGRVPFEGDTAIGLMYAQFYHAPPPLAQFRPDVPAEVAEAVMRMLEKDPEHRWPSLEAAVKAVGMPQVEGIDDPIRVELAHLGSSGSVPKLLALSHTPNSPLPRMSSTGPRSNPGLRSNPNAVTIPFTASGASRRLRRGIHLSGPAWAGVGGIVMVAVLYGLGVFHGRAAPAPVVMAPPPAVAESTKNPSAARKPKATSVVRHDPKSSPGASTPPVRKEVSAAPPPLPADPRTDTVATRAAIDVVIKLFRQAIESRDLSRVSNAYPGLTVKQQEEFTQLFGKADNLRMTLVVEKLNKLTANSAEVTLRGSYQYTDHTSHRNKLDDYKKKATLAFAAGAWRLSDIH